MKSRGVDTWNEWFSASMFKSRVGLADFDTVLFDASRSRMIKHNSVLGEGALPRTKTNSNGTKRCTVDIYIKERGVIECSSVRKGRYEDLLRGGRFGHEIVKGINRVR